MKLPFFRKKKIHKKESDEIFTNIPHHVAIIMDGNGRWASAKGLPRILGHREGMNNVTKTVRAANKYGVKILTLYAFSTENWKRPKDEVDFIMRLPKEFLHVYLPEMIENNVQIRTIGEFHALPDHTKEAVQYAVDQTKDNDGLILNLALNYGSRYEILCAMKRIMKDVESHALSIDDIDEQLISSYLYTNDTSDPDLLIRTSGEKRVSNFLLWQIAYSEFWFTDVLWPDFDEEVFIQALEEYEQRKRRYGGV